MNRINFGLINGFPLNQDALDRLQTAFSLFNALGDIVGDKTIISGCELTGSTVADGVVYVNGEVFEFKGGLIQTKVIIKEDLTSVVYKNSNSYPVIKTRYVTFGTGIGSIDWADFKRGFATKDIAAGLLGKADQSSFDALADAFALVYAKMLTIAEGAEVNVQPDWNQTDNTQDDFIKNKPSTISYLAKGTAVLGDCEGADDIKTVIFPSVGTNNYMVVASMVSTGSNHTVDNDVIWMIREKTNTSFKVTMREVASLAQNLSLDYILIPL